MGKVHSARRYDSVVHMATPDPFHRCRAPWIAALLQKQNEMLYHYSHTSRGETGDDESTGPTPALHRSRLPRAALDARTGRAGSIDLRGTWRTDDGAAEACPGAAVGERWADERLPVDRSDQAKGFASGRTADRVPGASLPDAAGFRLQDRKPERLRPVRPSRA